ncbi:4-(cytidine 5'-diphospho)-2-C-methyl-D-erythritol kinase, partial [Micromonospora aurantiaca]|nr:4-(cytidine 5'-diphospho)-2-C-methyl-D-erythritol kinase [Micromonospora aurantiaca]
STDALLAALRQRDPRVLAATLGNDLQDAALTMRPSLAETLKAGEAAGALAGIVSGSGPTCVFLANGEADAVRIAAEITAAGVCREARVAHGPVAGARVV